MLNGSANTDVHWSSSITGRGDVMIPQSYIVDARSSRDGIKAVSSCQDGVLVNQGSSTHHLETSTKPLSTEDDGPWPGSLGSHGSSNYPGLGPAHPTLTGYWRLGGGGGGRTWRGHRSLAAGLYCSIGVCTTHCEVKSFKPTWTSYCLEQVCQNLLCDPLLQYNL